MTRRPTEAELRARFDLSQDDPTCMFSEHGKVPKIPYAESELSATWDRYYANGDAYPLCMGMPEMMRLRHLPARQTCMFSEHAHHVELANRDEQAGGVVEVPWWVTVIVGCTIGGVAGSVVWLVTGIIVLVERLP